jgi:hypothetical protein
MYQRMDVDALEIAGERLQWAEEALADLNAATSFILAEKAWASFLVASSAFYSKLDQGSKGNGKSVVWFGLKKRQRKDDPVLRYLKFARNSDQHGIQRVTERQNAGWPDIPFGKQVKTFIQMRDPVTGEPNGPEMRAFLYSEHIAAVRVWDRGQFCDPPREFVGDRDGAHPPDMGELALEKLRDILEEAATFV